MCHPSPCPDRTTKTAKHNKRLRTAVLRRVLKDVLCVPRRPCRKTSTQTAEHSDRDDTGCSIMCGNRVPSWLLFGFRGECWALY